MSQDSLIKYQPARRVVIKIGSSSVCRPDHTVNTGFIERIAAELAELVEVGIEVVLVCSGAIAAGMGRLKLDQRPTDVPTLQACASFGQVALVDAWTHALEAQALLCGQVLFTRHDTASRTAYLNARNTLTRILDLGGIAIINENDTTSIEQVRFGDNDTLAALAASMVGADLVVLLSDIDGLYTAHPGLDPHAKHIAEVPYVDESIQAMAQGSGSAVGTGGMQTKIHAARILGFGGVPLVIAHAETPHALVDAALGRPVGTRFLSQEAHRKSLSRRFWIALGDNVAGTVVIDEGAEHALVDKGASLLWMGVTNVSGDFTVEQMIEVKNRDGRVIARGLARLSASEVCDLMAGLPTDLPLARTQVLIHRDELLVF